jgi:transposase
MLYLSASIRYYYYNQSVDMRKGSYGLCGVVSNEMKKDIMTGDVFIFLNKRHNKIKLLQWEKDGFCMYEKRLTKGTFECPETMSDGRSILLDNIQLQHILQGIILQSVRFKKRYQRL